LSWRWFPVKIMGRMLYGKYDRDRDVVELVTRDSFELAGVDDEALAEAVFHSAVNQLRTVSLILAFAEAGPVGSELRGDGLLIPASAWPVAAGVLEETSWGFRLLPAVW
jgi:hypothetical protein